MDIGHRLIDVISYKLVTGVSAYGDPTLGSLLTMKGFIEEHHGVMKSGNGKDSAYSHMFVTDSKVGSELPRGVHLWLPGANTSDADAAFQVIGVSVGTRLGGGYTVIQHLLSSYRSGGSR